MNRAELQVLTRERLKDAKALLGRKRWEFAYYVAGYSVECAIKSCILTRMIHTGWVFQEKWDAKACMVHDFDRLIDLAALRDELNSKFAESAASGGVFLGHWGTVRQWQVTSRYEARTEAQARSLFDAITDKPEGVLKWIQKYW